MRHLNKNIWPYTILLRNVTSNSELGAYIQLDGGKAKKINDWCNQRIGKLYHDWYTYYIDGNDKIYAFKDEASLLAFKLTWGYNGN